MQPEFYDIIDIPQKEVNFWEKQSTTKQRFALHKFGIPPILVSQVNFEEAWELLSLLVRIAKRNKALQK
jgi:hypothetical protein